MNTIDLSPLYRSSIGFDHFGSLLDSALRSNKSTAGYPPYDIEVIGENEYAITLSVAGFKEENLDIQVEKDILTIRGKVDIDDKRKYIYRGINNKSFEHKFNLADYIEVKQARYQNGLLTISLLREVPEAMKPKRITINSGESRKVLEHKSEEVSK